jgi:protein-S-isoprenylcysteine O-methyltransferase Ste14
MMGFLLQWPTLVTFVMFPILAVTYVRLARRDEVEIGSTFGAAWDEYAARTPGFVPALWRHSQSDRRGHPRAA